METDELALAALESAWYEVMEAALAGRINQQPCPECHAEGLRAEQSGDRVVVSCPACQRSVEFVNTSA